MSFDLLTEMLKANKVLWVTAAISGTFSLCISILNIIWLYLQQKKQLEYDKKLENYKSSLSSKVYVSKVRFDTEFHLYRQLTDHCRDMVSTVYFIYPTYANEVFETAQQSYVKFSQLITSNAPFIPKDFYDKFISIMRLCKRNLDAYAYRWNKGYLGTWEGSPDQKKAENEAYERTGDISTAFESLIDDIRIYLNKLDVSD